jgi:hypothetical protein
MLRGFLGIDFRSKQSLRTTRRTATYFFGYSEIVHPTPSPKRSDRAIPSYAPESNPESKVDEELLQVDLHGIAGERGGRKSRVGGSQQYKRVGNIQR